MDGNTKRAPKPSKGDQSANEHGVLKSKFADVEIPTDVSLAEYVMSDFDQYGDRVAMIEGLSNRSYTYKQLKTFVRRCGSGLVKAGFTQGDVCALYTPNSPEFFVSFYAVVSIGGVITGVNPLHTPDELAYQLKLSDAHWLITHPAFVQKAKQAVEKFRPMKGIYVLGNEGIGDCVPCSKLLGDDGSAFPSSIKINPTEDIVTLPFSSGTTGLPKGVMLTHYNIVANLAQLKTPGMLDFEAGVDVILGILPFYHIYAMVCVLTQAVKRGALVVTLPQFDPETFLNAIQQHKVTFCPIVPPLALFLAKYPLLENYNLSSLKKVMSGAAPIGPHIIEAVKSRMNRRDLMLKQGYGLTECSPGVAGTNTDEEYDVSTVGVLLPNTELKVVDVDTGKILGANEDGELCCKGPQVMKGYLNNPNATEMTIVDGWLHTGDIGHYDETGQIFIVDRLKELIKYKGFQVAPAELEEVILTMPDVKDVAVIGLPDEEAGEIPIAFVVPKTEKVTPDDIIKFVEGKVAPYKKLRGGVKFVDRIPKSASGKILRRVLKARQLDNTKKA
ncbi:uncharacterized protein [Ptychodera flava]|uniref:uncharacterized protein n=1 Tax=Ptychodera flava TaxID=63121 RepID=UPI003969E973